MCGQRLARASAWAAATAKLTDRITAKRGDGQGGLSVVEEFRPLDDAAPQVLVFKRDADTKPGMAVTLTVYRGCISKRNGKEVVRT